MRAKFPKNVSSMLKKISTQQKNAQVTCSNTSSNRLEK
jgi:hypothetical protein